MPMIPLRVQGIKADGHAARASHLEPRGAKRHNLPSERADARIRRATALPMRGRSWRLSRQVKRTSTRRESEPNIPAKMKIVINGLFDQRVHERAAATEKARLSTHLAQRHF
jgi:hypothetical protein